MGCCPSKWWLNLMYHHAIPSAKKVLAIMHYFSQYTLSMSFLKTSCGHGLSILCSQIAVGFISIFPRTLGWIAEDNWLNHSSESSLSLSLSSLFLLMLSNTAHYIPVFLKSVSFKFKYCYVKKKICHHGK